MSETITRNDVDKQFSRDPLYRKCVFHGLEEYLFTAAILNLEKDGLYLYNTVQTGRIIDRNDSTVRNYFRTDLVYYVQPVKRGKYFRLNWVNIVRLKLITVLIERIGITTEKILSEVTDFNPIAQSSDSFEGSHIMKDDSPILNSENRSIEYKELFNLFSLFEKKMNDYTEKMRLENEIFRLDYSIEKEYGHIRELKIQLENLLLMEILKLTVKSTSRNNQSIIGRLLNKEEAMTVENELSVETI